MSAGSSVDRATFRLFSSRTSDNQLGDRSDRRGPGFARTAFGRWRAGDSSQARLELVTCYPFDCITPERVIVHGRKSG